MFKRVNQLCQSMMIHLWRRFLEPDISLPIQVGVDFGLTQHNFGQRTKKELGIFYMS